MEIKILGTGCCTMCAALLSATHKAVAELSIDASVEEITDMEKILSYNIMRTPALVVGQKVLSSGKVLSVEEVKKLLTQLK